MSDFLIEEFSDAPLENKNGFDGYGQSNMGLDTIKALIANDTTTNIALLQQGGALQAQSLETQLALLMWQEKHLKFYKDIGITGARSTLEEFSIQDGYGTESGFIDQMGVPEEDDADLQRKYAIMKYTRAMWRVGDVLQLTNLISNAEVLQVQAAMMRTLRTIERTLFFGDSDIIPQAFDGIIKIIKTLATSQHVVDLRGASITEIQLRLGAELINSNFGNATKLYVSNSTKTTIDNILTGASAQRIIQNDIMGQPNLALGSNVTTMKTAWGDFVIEPDIFLNQESQGVTMIKDPATPGAFIEGATSTKSPATPTFTLTPQTGTSGSLWAASGSGGAIAGGAYNYRIVAVNQYGKSAAAAAQVATVVAAGSMLITITSGGGAYPPTGYEIYRETIPASGIYLYMASVKKASTATTTYTDLNGDLPGTAVAVLIDNTTVGEARTMALSQLAPIHKVEYAKIGPYKWGTVNYYAVPKWYAPLRYVLYKNIGVNRLIRSPVLDL